MSSNREEINQSAMFHNAVRTFAKTEGFLTYSNEISEISQMIEDDLPKLYGNARGDGFEHGSYNLPNLAVFHRASLDKMNLRFLDKEPSSSTYVFHSIYNGLHFVFVRSLREFEINFKEGLYRGSHLVCPYCGIPLFELYIETANLAFSPFFVRQKMTGIPTGLFICLSCKNIFSLNSTLLDNLKIAKYPGGYGTSVRAFSKYVSDHLTRFGLSDKIDLSSLERARGSSPFREAIVEDVLKSFLELIEKNGSNK